MRSLDTIPPELIASILSELSLQSLIDAAHSCRTFRNAASDTTLNPWRTPISHILKLEDAELYDPLLRNLSVRSIVPRQNWVDILSMADCGYVLFEATLPNLAEDEWEEAFMRRFLPSWTRWKKDDSWQRAFKRILHRLWHRANSSCTADEAWTKYIVLNRVDSANELYGVSKGFSPLTIHEEMKQQANLLQLETQVRVLVHLQDVRILCVGTLKRTQSNFLVNSLAKQLLRPGELSIVSREDGEGPPIRNIASDFAPFAAGWRMKYPSPAKAHYNYPSYSRGGADQRWLSEWELVDDDMKWMGGLMLIVQVIPVQSSKAAMDPLGADLLQGSGKNQFISFGWEDLWAVAPWMKDKITRRITGSGLEVS